MDMPHHNNDFFTEGLVRKQLCFHLSPQMNTLFRRQTMALAGVHCVALFFSACFHAPILQDLPPLIRVGGSLSGVISQTGCPVVLDQQQ